MKKRIFVLLLLMVILVLPACKSAEPEALTTVRINSSKHISHAPIMIADKEGYFADYGIQIESVFFNRTTEAVPLVVSGDLDVYCGGITTGLMNSIRLEENFTAVADRGQIFADMDCSFMGMLVHKDLIDSGEVKAPADFEGLKLVTNYGGPGEFFASNFLSDGGLTLEDLEVTDIPKASYIDAMNNKSVDAIVGIELNLSQVLSAGDAVLLTGIEDVIGDFQSSAIVFGKRFLEDDPALGARFLAAYMKGVEQYNQGKTERNLEIISEASEMDIEVLRNACWIPISQDGVPNYAGLIEIMDWAVDKGYIDEVVTEEQFFDPSFLEAANELMGSE